MREHRVHLSRTRKGRAEAMDRAPLVWGSECRRFTLSGAVEDASAGGLTTRVHPVQGLRKRPIIAGTIGHGREL